MSEPMTRLFPPVPVAAIRSAQRAAEFVAASPARTLLAFIWVYQRAVSPVLPVIFGGNCGCRFAPTCSHYAAEAVRIHGAIVGTFLAVRRLIKCTPLHPGGIDLVPLPRTRPVCQNANPPGPRFAVNGAASMPPARAR